MKVTVWITWDIDGRQSVPYETLMYYMEWTLRWQDFTKVEIVYDG